MRKIHDYIDEINNLFDKIMESWEYRESKKIDDYEMEKDQPKHFSWLHVWASADGLATDQTVALTYLDAEDFQQEVINAVREFINTDSLQSVIDGKLTMLGIQIGPERPSGSNINKELGIEVEYDR